MYVVLDLEGVDVDDFDEMERVWNEWVRDLFARGYRPADEPEPQSTDTRLVYRRVLVGSAADETPAAASASDAA